MLAFTGTFDIFIVVVVVVGQGLDVSRSLRHLHHGGGGGSSSAGAPGRTNSGVAGNWTSCRWVLSIHVRKGPGKVRVKQKTPHFQSRPEVTFDPIALSSWGIVPSRMGKITMGRYNHLLSDPVGRHHYHTVGQIG
jgi:hypothetical protein